MVARLGADMLFLHNILWKSCKVVVVGGFDVKVASWGKKRRRLLCKGKQCTERRSHKSTATFTYHHTAHYLPLDLNKVKSEKESFD